MVFFLKKIEKVHSLSQKPPPTLKHTQANTMVHSTSHDVLVIVETFTSSLERIPLEEFRTSAAARATFLKALSLAEIHFADLVDEINTCQSDLKEIRELGLDSHIQANEDFIAAGTPLRDRFIACYHAIKDVVLDGSHEEIDEFALDDAKGHVAYVEEAIGQITA